MTEVSDNVIPARADLAGASLLQSLREQIAHAEQRASAAEELAEQLQHALNSRVVIEQANGVLAERHGIGVDAAFDLMRGFARRHQRKLHEVAAAVVDGREDPGLTK